MNSANTVKSSNFPALLVSLKNSVLVWAAVQIRLVILKSGQTYHPKFNSASLPHTNYHHKISLSDKIRPDQFFAIHSRCYSNAYVLTDRFVYSKQIEPTTLTHLTDASTGQLFLYGQRVKRKEATYGATHGLRMQMICPTAHFYISAVSRWCFSPKPFKFYPSHIKTTALHFT